MGDVSLYAGLEKYKTLSIVIQTPAQKEQAQLDLIALRKDQNALRQAIQNAKRPYLDAIQQIDKASKEWKDLLEQKDQEFERAITAYNNRVREQVAALNRKEVAKHEKKVEKAIDKAVEANAPIPFIAPPALHQAPAKTEVVGGAQVTTVTRKAWRLPQTPIGHLSPETLTASMAEKAGLKIPLEYFKLDTAKIGKVVRAGGTIPGIEVYDEESLTVKPQ